MKKVLIILVNVIIMSAILFFVVQYSNARIVESSRQQVDDFGNSTVAMGRVTANYLEGEQHICDTWANYINSTEMTSEDAVKFLTKAIIVRSASAQILFPENGTYTGLSTEAHSNDPSDNSVSYEGLDIFPDDSVENADGSSVHATRAYINPVNGIESLAFYRSVTLTDNGTSRKALLLRVLPVSILEQKWVFPNEDYDDAEITLIDTDGNYMIRAKSTKYSNFFEFYRSTKQEEVLSPADFEKEITTGTGTMTILNSQNVPTLISYTRVKPTSGWTLISYLPMSGLKTDGIDWVLVSIVFIGLLLLFIIDFTVLFRLNSALRQTALRAESANKAKTYFLSTMSHDIRTPMNSILGMNEMVMRECSDEEILMYSEHIRTSGNTLLGLINDILDFSKIEAGKLDIIPVDYDLASVLNDLVNMAQNAAEAKGLRFDVNIDRNTPKYLNGDEIRIKQAITNLLSNAVKYTKQGTVSFNIGYEDIENEPESIILNVSVEDTGIGIKEEDIEKLFAAFQRIDEKKNRGIEGTGLGITITQRLLDMMESSLRVKSEYGKGSVFSFSLKQRVVKRETVGDYETAFRRSVAERKQYREKFTAPDAHVLAVDDTPVNLTVFKSLLKRTEIQIDTAESGDECIARASKTRYDIIFLDHMMPDKDGIETLGELKALRNNPNSNTPVICLTANAVSGMREMYLESGFDDYITKPIDPDTLETMIIAYLPKDRIKPPKSDEETGEAVTIPEFMYSIGEIDVSVGVKHCGSPEAYIDTVKTYLDTAVGNIDEIERFRSEGNIKHIIVKVHAIKSTSRIIGAEKLGAFAEKLEKAGKDGDTETLCAELDRLLFYYRALAEKLAPLEAEADGEKELPLISGEKLSEAYGAIRRFAEDLDYDSVGYVTESLSAYRLPENEQARYEKLRQAAMNFDYDSIPDILDEGDKQ